MHLCLIGNSQDARGEMFSLSPPTLICFAYKLAAVYD